MKKVIRAISIGFLVLSLLFLVYGSIKLARAEATPPPLNIVSGIPQVEIEQPSPLINKHNAQLIMGVSLMTAVLGGTGLLISLRTSREDQTNVDFREDQTNVDL